MKTLTVREITPDDAEQVNELDRAIRGGGWIRSARRRNPSAAYLIAEVSGVAVGRARVSVSGPLADDIGQVSVAVRPSHRRMGYGAEILRQCLTMLAAQGVTHAVVTCRVDNLASAAMIEKLGGEFTGTTIRQTGKTQRGTILRRYLISTR